MVYVSEGLRAGALKQDPLNVAAPPGTYCKHTPKLSHGQSILAHDQSFKIACYRVFQNMSVQNFPNMFCREPNAFFDIQINGAPVDILLGCYMHFLVTNSNSGVGATSVTPMLSHAFFEKIEVQPNGASTDDTIYTEQIYYNYLRWLNNDQERIARGVAVGMATYGTAAALGTNFAAMGMFDEDNTAIVPTGSRRYLFPVINFMTQAALPLITKRVDPRFRVFGRVNPITTVNANADLTGTPLVFSSMESIFDGIRLQPHVRDAVTTHYREAPTMVRILLNERFTQPVSSIQPLQYLADIQLSPFSGEYASIITYVDRNDAVREFKFYGSNVNATAATRNPLPMGLVTFNTSSSRPIYYNDHPANMYKNVFAATTEYEVPVWPFKNVYPIDFCLKRDTFQSGINTGGLAMDGAFMFKFMLDQNLTAGTTTSCVLVMLGSRYGVLELTVNGGFKVSKL